MDLVNEAELDSVGSELSLREHVYTPPHLNASRLLTKFE